MFDCLDFDRITQVMTKAVDNSISTTEKTEERASSSRRLFFVNLFDLSWRMLGAMLLPIFVGKMIDSKVGHGQTYALIGFGLGIVLSAFVLRNVIIKISKGADKN